MMGGIRSSHIVDRLFASSRVYRHQAPSLHLDIPCYRGVARNAELPGSDQHQSRQRRGET